MRFLLLIIIFAMSSACITSKVAVGDSGYSPEITPIYPSGKGSIVKIDEGHNNYHTIENRFAPFARLLKKDGYKVSGIDTIFSETSLSGIDILVISNPLHISNREVWDKPNPSAFSDKEIAALKNWVASGGSLFLIADHLPFPGSVEKLAEVFGFRWNNGYAFDENRKGTISFSRASRMLKSHAITNGSHENEKIDSFTTFTGSAFKSPNEAEPVLVFTSSYISLMPEKSWDLTKITPTISIDGWHQGATLEYKKGRIAVFGEASAFTAQISGKNHRKFGMNSPLAQQNFQFVLNVVHWLDEKL